MKMVLLVGSGLVDGTSPRDLWSQRAITGLYFHTGGDIVPKYRSCPMAVPTFAKPGGPKKTGFLSA